MLPVAVDMESGDGVDVAGVAIEEPGRAGANRGVDQGLVSASAKCDHGDVPSQGQDSLYGGDHPGAADVSADEDHVGPDVADLIKGLVDI
jgi:hypothetical protein